jgi:hypothetical protein
VHAFDAAGIERASGQYGGPDLVASASFLLSRVEIRDEHGAVWYSGLPTATGLSRVMFTGDRIRIRFDVTEFFAN